MVATPSSAPPRSPAVAVDVEARVVLHNIPWATYVALRDAVDGGGVKMTYLEGTLEIMSPSRRHEVTKKQIARLLELLCLEWDIPLFGYGSTTMRSEPKKRGLEPDECYARGGDKETPDVAIEVIVTHGLDKMEVYRGLGVREVWIFEDDKPQVMELRGEKYEQIEASVVFPEVDLAKLLAVAVEPDQHAALKRFRDELRRGR